MKFANIEVGSVWSLDLKAFSLLVVMNWGARIIRPGRPVFFFQQEQPKPLQQQPSGEPPPPYDKPMPANQVAESNGDSGDFSNTVDSRYLEVEGTL